MTITFRGVTTVLLPGTGSDDDYVYRAFAGPLHGVGAVVTTPPPQPGRLIASYLDALDDASRQAPVVVGGVSIGAAVAVAWAVAHPGRAVAVLAALPPWTGAPQSAPAALSARHTAHQLRTTGLVATTAQMRASSPAWLADELTRSWLGQWPELPDAMEEAAGYAAPSIGELERLTVPMGVVGAADDPIHPLEVAVEWVAAAPYAALRTVSLEDFGPDPSVLGAACLAALDDAGAARA
ncbi:alpha/beta hydrolase [Mycobacterium sp. CVI_P3]|uniref:Alpha/beta hydrolase n=1 Tax=Mycobacterium pinniadriaticum TaxID=2994102 RepID=A0ABT3SI91_9MYCO|nr:alpha/beta hydrolase [Mycobacterium pinniadriaticum]MCX2932821.1 alpha/beta hydrolase [Mycobacterium pinniadriaticum]MCX2939245.1 alpha/beta hydrolase [Mycobacterium pinniadriaticum]